jgi:hypothetical protein
MMKRIVAAGFALVAVVALSGIGVSSASAAAGCYRTMTPNQGNFTKPNCEAASKVAVLTGEYILAETLVPAEKHLRRYP